MTIFVVLNVFIMFVSSNFCAYSDWEFKSFVITSNSIEILKDAVDSSLSTIISEVTPSIIIPGASLYLSYSSCLGYNGALGVYGALGYLGPIGSNTWNPSLWIESISSIFPSELTSFYYFGLSSSITENAFSYFGPLGPNGPLNPTAYCQILPSINSWSKHLQIGGVFTFLGPLSVLGVLGPLGPLGPTGRAAVIYNIDNNGNYVDENDNIITQYTVYNNDNINDGIYKTYALYENYDTIYAQNNILDTSWMTEGYLTYSFTEDIYKFVSYYTQYVTVLVVPINYYDSFKLEMYINQQSGNVIISDSDCNQYINGAQLKINNGDQITLTVKQGNLRWIGKYRIYVVGASHDIDGTDIYGIHMLTNYMVFGSNQISQNLLAVGNTDEMLSKNRRNVLEKYVVIAIVMILICLILKWCIFWKKRSYRDIINEKESTPLLQQHTV